MAIIEVPDIGIVKNNKIYSLKDQKILHNGQLYSFGVGSGIKKDDNIYVLKQDLEPIVRMITTKDSVSFTVTKNGDIEVDWGDGMKEKNVFKHTYTDGVSEHEIVFYGSQTTALTYLNCSYNNLTFLNISKNTALTCLDCSYNNLTSLNVSKNTSLIYLNCVNNPIITNQENLTVLANSLPQREVADKADFWLSNSTSAIWIQDICDAKNWTIQ